MGVPCAHTVRNRQEIGLGLNPDDFHPHWWWNRHQRELDPPILEPLQLISKGAPRKSTKYSTKRLPSGFEITERSNQRKCGACGFPGHNRRSMKCMHRLAQIGQELELGNSSPRSNEPDSPTESIPSQRVSPALSSSTIVVCTQHTSIMTRATASETSHGEPEAQSTTIPEVETDSRPIYPNRIEMVYDRYLTRKKAYLQAHPKVKESQYRRAIGLKTWNVFDRRHIKETKLKYFQRLNIYTREYVDGRPNWTNEELDAFLDFEEEEDRNIERLENERFASMGERNTETGLGAMYMRIIEEGKRDEELYSFVYI